MGKVRHATVFDVAANEITGSTIERHDGTTCLNIPDRGRYFITAQLDRCYVWQDESGKQSGGFLADPYECDHEAHDEAVTELLYFSGVWT